MSRLIFLGLALVAFLVSLILAVRTLLFVVTAEQSIGTVTEIQSSNSSCKKSRRVRTGRRYRVSRVYHCTKFKAAIQYRSALGELYSMERGAGRARGHNQPLSGADFSIGHTVPVLYNPASPTEARLNQFDDLWLGPGISALFGGILGFCSFLPLRRRLHR